MDLGHHIVGDLLRGEEQEIAITSKSSSSAAETKWFSSYMISQHCAWSELWKNHGWLKGPYCDKQTNTHGGTYWETILWHKCLEWLSPFWQSVAKRSEGSKGQPPWEVEKGTNSLCWSSLGIRLQLVSWGPQPSLAFPTCTLLLRFPQNILWISH